MKPKQSERSKRAWRKWRKLVSEQAKSEQSVAAFCRERGLCAPHLFAWKKRLSEADTAKFVAVKVTTLAAPEAVTQQVPIEVRLSNGRCLLVAPGFDASHLRAVLAAVEAVA
jgi:hypothetical protein